MSEFLSRIADAGKRLGITAGLIASGCQQAELPPVPTDAPPCARTSVQITDKDGGHLYGTYLFGSDTNGNLTSVTYGVDAVLYINVDGQRPGTLPSNVILERFAASIILYQHDSIKSSHSAQRSLQGHNYDPKLGLDIGMQTQIPKDGGKIVINGAVTAYENGQPCQAIGQITLPEFPKQ